MVKELTTDRDAFKPTAEQEALNELQRQLQVGPLYMGAMTQAEAENKHGLRARSYPEGEPFLRCQLGREVIEPRMVPREPGISELVKTYLPFFHILAWGHSWQRASDNYIISRRGARK